MATVIVGQKVKVMNQRLDGTPFVEGEAVITEVVEEMNNGFYACNVKFENDDQEYFRWIDANIQRKEVTETQ